MKKSFRLHYLITGANALIEICMQLNARRISPTDVDLWIDGYYLSVQQPPHLAISL